MSTRGEGPSRQLANFFDQKFTIFINYRRDDTGDAAGRLSDRLKAHFGTKNVYLDVTQSAGVDWRAEIEAKGANARAFLALIGPAWLPALRARSEGPSPRPIDFTRREIESALCESSVTVIPVLVGAPKPTPEDLPRSIRGLFGRQAVALRNESYESDLAHLIAELETVARETPSPADDCLGESSVVERTGSSSPASGVPEPNHDHYVKVATLMGRGKVVPLLGPSVRGSLPEPPALPPSWPRNSKSSRVRRISLR